MEIFVSTSDGKHPCLRHRGVLYYCTADELAEKFGLTEFQIELDQGQRARDRKEFRRKAIQERNANLQKPWGY